MLAGAGCGETDTSAEGDVLLPMVGPALGNAEDIQLGLVAVLAHGMLKHRTVSRTVA